MNTLRMSAAIAIVAFALTLGLSGNARATEVRGRVDTQNRSDAYVLVTVYVRGTMSVVPFVSGSWCVRPGRSEEHDFIHSVAYVQFEVTRQDCKGRPMEQLLRVRRDFSTRETTQTYVVSGSKTTPYEVR